jgi:GDP-4-dehydro-6-deoxy-D-mannose reductase
MSILVTGGSGVFGYHLLDALQDYSEELYSFSTTPPPPYRMVNRVRYQYGNLNRPQEIRDFIEQTRPTEIYHIASVSSSHLSSLKGVDTLSTHVMGTQNLLDAVRQFVPKARVLLLSSSEVYGRGEKGLLDVLHEENSGFNPLTHFASSKAALELIGQQFYNAWDIPVISVRPFYITGPHQSRKFTLPHVAEQLIRIKHKMGEPVLYTGNLDISRDMLDVRDLSRALILCMRNSTPGEAYNICSGKTRTLREAVEYLILQSGMEVELRHDPQLECQLELPMLIGSPNKIRQTTGWKPLISIEDSLQDMLVEMDKRVQREKKLHSN